MESSTIFSYQLRDAWGYSLCNVSVSVGASKARVRYKAINKKRYSRQLDDDIIYEINTIMERHPEIWTYNEFDLEEPTGLLDGVMNFFEFATLDGKNVHFSTSNIGEIRNPNAHFSLNFFNCSSAKDLMRNVIPTKALEVVKTFDEISAVLVRIGIPKECFLLQPK